MTEAFICDAIRTPIGRYGGALSAVRTDDLAALPISQLMARNQSVDWDKVDDVIYGCVNQAGEDNRNVARMALLLAGLPKEISGVTVNRLCASGLHAVGAAAQAIKSGDAALVVAGGVESMSRSPFVMPKADTAFSRKSEIYDTTIGWRFINPKMDAEYGTDALGVTAENLAEKYQISREDQDAFAMDSQNKAAAAQSDGRMAEEIMPVTIPQRRGDDVVVAVDEHPRGDTSMETLGKLRAAFRDGGSVTAGNSSGVNDGAAALVIASEEAVKEHGLVPRARILGMASAGVEPRLMGIGPVPAIRKLLEITGMTLSDIDRFEINEAFSAQLIAVERELGLDREKINVNGGATALGHPLAATGLRCTITCARELKRSGLRWGIASACCGGGQGSAVLIENPDTA